MDLVGIRLIIRKLLVLRIPRMPKNGHNARSIVRLLYGRFSGHYYYYAGRVSIFKPRQKVSAHRTCLSAHLLFAVLIPAAQVRE